MENEELIPIDSYCEHEGLDITFIKALHGRGLISVVHVEQRRYLAPAHVVRLERIVRLHYDLEINLEGIEAIDHLLQRMEDLRAEADSMRQRLRIYENED